ncbi:MAG: hypothetical protein AVDCRST_MAG40-1828, partial [uncultured Gemmatimonadaceae bacterium]
VRASAPRHHGRRARDPGADRGIGARAERGLLHRRAGRGGPRARVRRRHAARRRRHVLPDRRARVRHLCGAPGPRGRWRLERAAHAVRRRPGQARRRQPARPRDRRRAHPRLLRPPAVGAPGARAAAVRGMRPRGVGGRLPPLRAHGHAAGRAALRRTGLCGGGAGDGAAAGRYRGTVRADGARDRRAV